MTIKQTLDEMEDEDLIFILQFSPNALFNMCYLYSLELQLQKEGKKGFGDMES